VDEFNDPRFLEIHVPANISITFSRSDLQTLFVTEVPVKKPVLKIAGITVGFDMNHSDLHAEDHETLRSFPQSWNPKTKIMTLNLQESGRWLIDQLDRERLILAVSIKAENVLFTDQIPLHDLSIETLRYSGKFSHTEPDEIDTPELTTEILF
jgi:hypothetical protein